MQLYLFKFVSLLLYILTAASGMMDKATGITFRKEVDGLALFGVGVRKKGPIKVYSIAAYSKPTLKEQMQGLDEKQAIDCLKEGPTTFCIEMAFKVGAEKMAAAIAEAVKGDASDVNDLKEKILHGLQKKGAATKGTTLQFTCDGAGVDIAVDGKSQGKVASASLSKAFCDVYLGDKAVSPALRSSILEHCANTTK
ncbi:hypothetical protein MPSEU_000372800 [Mayamaea pseudoterrestris]|nr:hypothetical protein MPSEU_000372800 [Mayamaea pseudoterrestris]